MTSVPNKIKVVGMGESKQNSKLSIFYIHKKESYGVLY